MQTIDKKYAQTISLLIDDMNKKHGLRSSSLYNTLISSFCPFLNVNVKLCRNCCSDFDSTSAYITSVIFLVCTEYNVIG